MTQRSTVSTTSTNSHGQTRQGDKSAYPHNLHSQLKPQTLIIESQCRHSVPHRPTSPEQSAEVAAFLPTRRDFLRWTTEP